MSHAFIPTHISKALAGLVLGSCLVFSPMGVQSATPNSVSLQWKANTESDLTGYKVYQGTTPGSYGLPIDVGNTTTYTAKNLQAGFRYYFVITAYDNSGNESAPSTAVSRQVAVPPVPTNPPSATLQWKANTESDLTGYKVYQGTTPGSYGLSIDVGNITKHTAHNLRADRRYYFAVTAYDNSGNESPPSTEVSR